MNFPTTREILTINELKSNISEFRRYFRKLLPNVDGESTIILYNREQLKAIIKYLNGTPTRHIAFHFLFELLLIDESENTSNLFTEDRCYVELYEQFPELFAQIVLENYVDGRDTECHRIIYEQFHRNISNNFKWNRFDWKDIMTAHKKEKIYYLIADSRSQFSSVIRSYIQTKYNTLRIDDLNYIQNKINYGKFKMKRFFNDIFKDSNWMEESAPLEFYLMNFATFYHLHNKPMAFYYATIGIKIWENLIKNAEISIDKFHEPCRLMMHSSTGRVIPKKIPFDSLIKFVAAREALEYYKEWAAENTQEVFRENSILFPHNYSGLKMFFHVYMQSKCSSFREFDYAFMGHSKEFGSEYQCAIGEKLNYKWKCVNRIF